MDIDKFKDRIVILKKSKKIEKKKIEPPDKRKVIETKKKVIMDSYNNVCNGSNPRKIFKIINHITPDLFDVYIFIGKLPSNIKLIIDKLEGNYDKLSKTDKHEIDNYFQIIDDDKQYNGSLLKKKQTKKKYIIDILNSKNKSGGKVVFIFDLINGDDSISIIKKKIFVHLSSKTKYITPELQHLWVKTKSDLYDKQLYNIFCSISENREYLERRDFISKLSIITDKDEDYINTYINLEEDIINYELFLNNSKIVELLKERVNIIGYKYQHKYGEINIRANPFKDLKIDTLFHKIDGSRNELLYSKDNFNILNEYETIVDNTIHLVILNDVSDYIKSGTHFIGDIKMIYNGFITKYWPYNDDKTIFDSIENSNTKSMSIYEEVKENINNRCDSTDIIYSTYLEAQKNISYDNCGLLVTVIHINFPGDEDVLNLETIFNMIELNKDIPFIKYKSDNSFDTKYKIFKGVTEIQENGRPYISEKKINSWRKNIILEKEGKTKITGIPKGLSIKLLLYKHNDSDYRFCNINILKDAKIEMKLYWTENKSANFDDIKQSVIRCKELINKINKLNISINNNPYYKIPLPDPNFIMKNNLETNTHLIFMNTITTLSLPPELLLGDMLNVMSCFSTYVSIIEEKQNLKKNIIHLRFKRISNYEKMSNIDTFINRKHQELENIDGKDVMIVNLIKQHFNKTKEEAGKIYVDWSNQVLAQQTFFAGKKYFEIKQEPGVDIKIQKNLSNNLYKIIIEGVKTIDQLKRINNFLKSIIYLFTQKESGLSRELCQTLSEDLDKKDSSISRDREIPSQVNTLGTLQNKSQTIRKTGFQFDSDSDSDMESDIEMTDSDKNTDSDSDIEIKTNQSSDKQNSSEVKTNTPINKKELLLRPIREYSLKRLYDADPELFKYVTNKSYQAYSTICGEVELRQPIVISKRDKELIDLNHPNSYNEFIEYGSKDKKNIYICPKYWCILCETSLNEDDVFNFKELFNTKIVKISKDTIQIDDTIPENLEIIKVPYSKNIIDSNIFLFVNQEKISVKNIISSKKTYTFENNEKITKHDKIKKDDVLYFKQKSSTPHCPKCGGLFIPKDKDHVKTENQTILVRESNYFRENKPAFPGFLDSSSHPEGLCMPCCFKKWDTILSKSRRDKCLTPSKDQIIDTKIRNERYIKNADKFPLDINKIGMLPNILNTLFGNDVNKMISKGKSGLLNEGYPVFLRKGIKQSNNNSFLRCISHIHNNQWNFRKENEFIEKHIISKLNPLLFSSLNNGDLVLIFRDNYDLNHDNLEKFIDWCFKWDTLIEQNQITDLLNKKLKIEDIEKWDIKKKSILYRIHNIYTSMINFESYLLSNSIKDEEYLWDFVSRENTTFKNGMNIVIFNRKNEEDLEDIHIMCPSGLSNKEIFDPNKKTCFLIKMGKYYEPIERILFYNGKQTVKKTFSFEKSKENTIYRNILLMIEKIIKENCFIKENDKYLDYKEKNNINFSFFNAIETCEKIKTITKLENRTNIIFQVVDYFNKVIGLVLQGGTHHNDHQQTFIPVKPSSIIKKYDIPILTSISSVNFKDIFKTYKTLNGLHNILNYEKNRINSKPIKLIVKHNLIIGIQNINSGIVPIYPTENFNNEEYNSLIALLKDETDNTKVLQDFLLVNEKFKILFNDWNYKNNSLKSINKKLVLSELNKIMSMEQTDINFIQNYDEQITINHNEIDERIKFMNQLYFENETFERIKFEISQFLQLDNKDTKMYKLKINNILNPKNIEEFSVKRIELKKHILEIILKLSKIDNSKDIQHNYNIKKEKIRHRCNNFTNLDVCNQQQHCIWENNILEYDSQISLLNKTKFKTTYPHIYEKYSSKLNENIITQGIFLANEQKLESPQQKLKKINEILIDYIKTSYQLTTRKENERFGGKCKLYINDKNFVDGKNNIEKYSSLIVEEILRNKIKRREILEGLISDVIQREVKGQDESSFIFTDEELNNGKLKILYEDKFDYYIKNKDIVNHEYIDDDESHSLPIRIQRILRYDFKMDFNSLNPYNLLECFAFIANRLSNNHLKIIFNKKFIFPGKYNYVILRNIFINHILNMDKKDGLEYWKYITHNYTHEKLTDKIDTFTNFEDYIKTDRYWYQDNDIDILHNIFKINVINFTRKTKTDEDFKISHNEEYEHYILLYKAKIKYTNKYVYNLIKLNEKYIFVFDDFSKDIKTLIKDKLTNNTIIIRRKKTRIIKSEIIILNRKLKKKI